MKKKLTYSEAYTKLEALVEQLEEGNIPLDKLAENVKQANEWVVLCEAKLRQIQSGIEEAASEVSKKGGGMK
jgi:exodeoxyribonuclease VII small subunit